MLPKFIIIAFGIILFSSLYLYGPIKQDSTYHNFADKRLILGCPNFMDVFSNAGFIIVGIYGLYTLYNRTKYISFLAPYYIFFVSVILVAFGSSYYHYSPNNETLVWDRLPMTIGFMSLFALIIGDYINMRCGRKLLVPLILVGLFSVLYWHYTELLGYGDLRPYAIIQFGPIITIPYILWLNRHKNNYNYWLVMLFYCLAKVFEMTDKQIFDLTFHYISGHSIKHVLAAISCFFIIRQI